jgi:hypothetical protein
MEPYKEGRWRGDSSSYQNLCGQDALSGALSFIQVRVLVVYLKYIIRLDYVRDVIHVLLIQ